MSNQTLPGIGRGAVSTSLGFRPNFLSIATGGVSGDQAWNIVYPQGSAAGAPAAAYQHDLWISPHGIVKAAIADKVAMSNSTFEIMREGRFRARATVGADNLVEKVESWIDNPVLGDMAVVTTYADYKDHGGAKFPSRITQTTRDWPRRMSPQENTFGRLVL